MDSATSLPKSVLDEWFACGFTEALNGGERYHFIAGQWVKAEPSHPQDTNTDYVAVPYEELKWTPEEGFTVLSSSNSPAL